MTSESGLSVISPPQAAAPQLRSGAGRSNPLLVLIVGGIAAAAMSLGFVSVAPNRILSGKPVALWSAVDPGVTALLVALIVGLGVSAVLRFGVWRDRFTAIIAAMTLLTTITAAGQAASLVAQASGPIARTSLGPAFWIIAAGSGFALADAMARLTRNMFVQMVVVAIVGGAIALLAASGALSDLSLAREFANRREAYGSELLRHLVLVGGALAGALPIGSLLGYVAFRRPKWRKALFAILNLIQTVPSIAIFGLLIGPLSALSAWLPLLRTLGIGGIGAAPAIIALTLYGLLPVARGVFTGLASTPPSVLDAARGMGFDERQILWRVSIPLALPILVTSLRLVVVQLTGLAVVAALIGAGGLGAFIFQGLGQTATDLILLGALSAIALALAADLLLRSLAAAVTTGASA
ncbi:osmoprotectant uptake system permease [Ancylobacter defluvii]|uniref:Osmoprotectant uptake system permease n=1 Tax=Ancylobacter defluvii TaxID=1282440 RepID=A0A9W6JXC5_9HYPH|nr:ABC transporter permease [Ancylobacter defluvii]GLK85591.1 osmoprotectant uptake system permease [Ancylobacter defluvii]